MSLFVADAVLPFSYSSESVAAILGASVPRPKLEKQFARVALSR